MIDESLVAEERDGSPLWVWAGLAGVLIAVALAGVVLWRLWPSTPGDGSPEAGFARDMSVHHAQAVELALILRDKTDDAALRTLATDIMLTQQAQIGRMGGWLALWNLRPTGAEPPMAWMGHPVDGLMPGMATAEQISALRELPVEEAEIEFLRLMIAHHQGGVHMAEAVVERTEQADVLRLANSMIITQQYEIELMEELLRERGAAVSPSRLAPGAR